MPAQSPGRDSARWRRLHLSGNPAGRLGAAEANFFLKSYPHWQPTTSARRTPYMRAFLAAFSLTLLGERVYPFGRDTKPVGNENEDTVLSRGASCRAHPFDCPGDRCRRSSGGPPVGRSAIRPQCGRGALHPIVSPAYSLSFPTRQAGLFRRAAQCGLPPQHDA